MLAFVDSKMTKEEVVERLEIHFAKDEIVKGQYWEDGRGCAVGCTIHSSNHKDYEKFFGIPQMLAILEDTIFEGLPLETAKHWPLRFISSVKVGSDLSLVGWKFLYWLLTDSSVNPGINHPSVKDAIKQCAERLNHFIQGHTITASASAAWSARSAARSAAESAASAAWSAASAAWSASAASAAWSARSAARSAAESAAASAAWSASASLAWSAAWSAAYVLMSNKLVELIESA